MLNQILMAVIALELAWGLALLVRRVRMPPAFEEYLRDGRWRDASIDGVRALVPELRELTVEELQPHHVRAAFDAALRGRDEG